MENKRPCRVKTISEFHRLCGLPKPEHPLISVINRENVVHSGDICLVLDFYLIAVKRGLKGKFTYGQQEYDFDEGVMFFIAPNQVYGKVETGGEATLKPSGWMLLIHPDFLWNTPLAKSIRRYDFFDYAVHEALFLSEKEESLLRDLIRIIEQEYRSNIDQFSKDIITSHIGSLLNYAERFYHRQFITREKAHHQVLERLERLLTEYFESGDLTTKGLPAVHFVAGSLNLSPSYLGNLLRMLTGKNTQQHIQDKLIEKAKEKLSTTDLSVSEIAYELGFEHLQSFSKFFKTKTQQSPLEFRGSFKN